MRDLSENNQKWHHRFKEQARWTESIRKYLLDYIKIPASASILEVGCGTGVILGEILKYQAGKNADSKSEFFNKEKIHGIDINYSFISAAKSHITEVNLVSGDALELPYVSNSFDLTCCHFLLMWLEKPEDVIAEMKRITRTGGSVIAFAEPDYGGRIDYPDELFEIGSKQTNALEQQGADPYLGRRLPSLFIDTGFSDIHAGIIGSEWEIDESYFDPLSEWKIIESDLKNLAGHEEIERYRKTITQAQKSGSRVLFVPTFYAVGFV